MAKTLKFDIEALKSITKGVRILSEAVSVTLGPRGRNVMIEEKSGSPVYTKDGGAIAKNITLKDKFENMGVKLVRDAALKTASMSGDGSTTTIVIAEAILNLILKNVAAGADPMLIRQGIDKAVQAVEKALDSMSTKIDGLENIKQIATISVNNDEMMGALIAEAIQKVGKDGMVSVAEAKGRETTLDIVKGMVFDKGYISPYFITNSDRMSIEFDDAYIFVTDKKLSGVKDVVTILEKAKDLNFLPLVIIAEDIEDEALATMVVNKLKGSMSICAVKAPGFGSRRKDAFEDIALLTGGIVLTEDAGYSLNEIDDKVFGRAKRVKITKDETSIIDGIGAKDKIEERIRHIRAEKNEADSDYAKTYLEKRLANLSGGVAVINIGANTEAELKEKKNCVEDALQATKAALKEGIVPGGGVAFLRASQVLNNLVLDNEDMQLGVNIIREALYAPSTVIANNCGKLGNVIAEKIANLQGSHGYNAMTDKFSDLILDGVVDPVLVTKRALHYAASIAGLLMTVTVAITDKK